MKNLNFDLLEFSGDFKTFEFVFTCPFCKTSHSLKNINSAEYAKYNSGELVQRAFPKMSTTDREKLMTGMCEKCQDEVFGSED